MLDTLTIFSKHRCRKFERAWTTTEHAPSKSERVCPECVRTYDRGANTSKG